MLNDEVRNVESKIKTIINTIKAVNDDFTAKTQKIREVFDTKEEVLTDMLKKFEIDTKQYRHSLQPIIEDLKSQQDLVKITVDVLKKQIQESVKEWVANEIQVACKNKEKEILMNIWIEELKEIIADIDKLKETNPKELKVHLKEISSIIESFRHKFSK
ncbi:MAG: hypothetical protein ACFE8N_12580, partial [Promethearchaeota archaeon]